MRIEKEWYEQKSVWGFVGMGIFGALNVIWPSDVLMTLFVLSTGWAGVGVATKLERNL